jgi:catalase
VFAAPARYDAWIRFSNGAPRVRPDTKRDQRGMAVKLVGVSGAKLLEDERDAVTQDFVLASAPRFFIRDPSSYAEFAAATARRHAGVHVLAFFFGWRPWAWRTHEFRALTDSLARAADLLATRYWSQTPSRLGPHVVKYSARPLDPTPYGAPGDDAGFLRTRLAERLAAGAARFEFLVQRYVDATRTPVEDATVEWLERDAPFERVATITVPAQAFATPERDALAEQLSFTPWHSLPAHEPVGGVNRLRRDVYRAISQYRHRRNGVAPFEPRTLDPEPDPAHPLQAST